MISTVLPQKTKVYEYSLTVFNIEERNSQKLTAAFIFIPTSKDWQRWLSGWGNCGYYLVGSPRLLHIY
ncbi:hypothetical protein [Myxosarcina sp. GI1]|uniref:hypothetical protein n=1 Tax=Myxosarcina sp. GI1 TaxID=1541065 RepID=UPI0005667926|nr:hypothetical protein [Myxosarcina sp. GI1]